MRCFLLGIAFLFAICGFSQTSESNESDSSKTISVLAFPIVFYLPQTRLGLGVGGMLTFRLPNEKKITRPSSFQFGAAYTMNDQLLLYLPFEFYKNNERWKLKGEIGYYKYFYYFYGRGIRSNLDDVETYDVTFPRLQVEILRRFRKVFFAGVNFRYDNFDITSIKKKGILDQSKLIGFEGGSVLGLGTSLQYDSRNNLFYPTKGIFLDYKLRFYQTEIGSDYEYIQSGLSASTYFQLDSLDVLAVNAILYQSSGNVPFFDFGYFASQNVMRGFNDRRFMDRNMLVFQVELRKHIWRRFLGTMFVSTGTVGRAFKGVTSNQYKTAAGLGLRYFINKKDRVALRLDYGITKEGGNVYLTVNQAF